MGRRGCLILVLVFWGLGVWLDSLVLRLCVLWWDMIAMIGCGVAVVLRFGFGW